MLNELILVRNGLAEIDPGLPRPIHKQLSEPGWLPWGDLNSAFLNARSGRYDQMSIYMDCQCQSSGISINTCRFTQLSKAEL